MDATFRLAISYSAHLLGTILWIGWSFLLVVASTTQDDVFVNRLRRWMPWALLGFAVLGGSGFYQMVVDAHYEDLLAITNAWSRAMLVKHLLYGLELVLLVWLELVFFPEFGLQQRIRDAGRFAPHYETMLRRLRLVAWVNGLLAVCVLVATAYMTALP